MASDSFPIEQDKPHKGMMTFKCQMKREDGVGDIDIGANASEENEDEPLQEAELGQGVNIVLNHRLNEMTLSKKEFKGYMKEALKELKEKVKENMKECKVPEDKIDEKIATFQADATNMVKWVLENHGDIQMMIGENLEGTCIPGFLINKGDEGIHMYYFKHALEEEKF